MYKNNSADWHHTFLNFKNKDPLQQQSTSFKNSKEFAFKCKLLTGELPTISHLQQYNYNTYKHMRCPTCLVEQETQDHV